MVGVVSVLSPAALLVAAGAATVIGGARLPPLVVVGLVLGIRNFTDPLASAAVGGAGNLNASAALGAWVIGVAALRIAMGRARSPGPWVVSFLSLYFIWFLIGVSANGPDASLVRELVRVLSIFAVFVIAVECRDDEIPPTRLLAVVVATGVVPALTAIATGGSFGEDNSQRASSTFSHPNAAADLFATDLTIAMALALAGTKKVRRYASIACAVLAIGLLASGSLGGIAQALAAALFLLLIGSYSIPAKVGTVVVVIALALAFFISPLGAERLADVRSTTSPSLAASGIITNSLDWRFFNWSQFLTIWHERPLIGWGSGSTASLLSPLGAPPHNDYVRLLVETGLLGAACFGSLIGFGVFRVIKALSVSVGEQRFATQTLLALLLGVGVNSVVGTPTLRTTTMVAMAAAIAAALTPRRKSQVKRTSNFQRVHTVPSEYR
ncbi:O-antigen ligase family protein [Patulibacter sp. NPDC049589]|uniref:O-antigen ligase family protein n=1 Tax=Patulibacter sp. NPDC049589 TaxID=3154731 RepID=UPI00342B89F2